MTEPRLALLVVIALSALTTVADVLVKKAAEDDRIASGYMFMAVIIYGGLGFGWFFTLKHMNLATLGAVYSLITVILLVAVGTLLFGEKLNATEIVVIVMAFVVLLAFWQRL